MDEIIVTTMNDLPDYEIIEVHGETFGLVARARNVFSNMGAGLRTVVGGEAKGYTKLLSDSRDQAIRRLREAAQAKGANAVSQCGLIAMNWPTWSVKSLLMVQR